MLSIGITEIRTPDLCINSYGQWLQFSTKMHSGGKRKKKEISFLQAQ
jgi:hypothetical protein